MRKLLSIFHAWMSLVLIKWSNWHFKRVIRERYPEVEIVKPSELPDWLLRALESDEKPTIH